MVLDYLAAMPDIEDRPLKESTLRTVLLLTLLTGQRGQTLHSLNVSDVRMFSQKCVLNFPEKQKHTRPGCHTEPATILAFSGNGRLCLVKHFRAYLEKTKDLRQGAANLFISFVRPHKGVFA